MPNKTRFLMTIYDLVLQWQGKENDFFSSDECWLTNRAFQHFRLSDLSVWSTQIILVVQLIYLFIASCMLHVTVTCIMLQKQVSVFSIFIITVYQSLKSNLCSFQMKTFLPSPVCLVNTVLVCLITSPVSDTNVSSK